MTLLVVIRVIVIIIDINDIMSSDDGDSNYYRC